MGQETLEDSPQPSLQPLLPSSDAFYRHPSPGEGFPGDDVLSKKKRYNE